MKRLIAFFVAIVMLLTLAACGGEPDPNEGKYLGIRGEMNGIVLTMEELYPGDSYLELKSGGKAVLVLEGDKVNGKWTLDGEDFNLVVEKQDCPGTLKDGIIEFDFAGSGIMLTFALEGVEVPEPAIKALDAGFYPLYAVDQDGEYTDNETIKMLGMDRTNYIVSYGDGTAEVVMEDEQIFCTYTDTHLVDDGGYETAYAIVDGFVEMYLDGNMTFYYEKGDFADLPDPPVSGTDELEPGFYPMYAVDEDGEYTDNDIITMSGLDRTNYIVVNEDGSVTVVLDGDKLLCTNNETCFVDESGYEIEYALVDGLIELYLEDDLTFFYQKNDSADVPTGDTDAFAAAFPEDIAEEFYGDWHGWCTVVAATGDYEENIDYEFEMLARYAFDAEGNCTPWMSIYSEPEDNFQNLSLSYNEDDQFVYISGQLFGMEIHPDSYMYESFDSLCLTIYLQDDAGTLDIVVCLRQLDAEWDSYDYPTMPEDALTFYAGKTFEERVELYGLDPAELPELS